MMAPQTNPASLPLLPIGGLFHLRDLFVRVGSSRLSTSRLAIGRRVRPPGNGDARENARLRNTTPSSEGGADTSGAVADDDATVTTPLWRDGGE